MKADRIRELSRHPAFGDLLSLLFFVALAGAATWPLARELTRAVANPGDPYLNAWILDWVQSEILRHPLQLFHANIFHPNPWTLAFSENLIGLAILLAPFRLIGLEPLTIHNLGILLGFAFSGWAAYFLGRVTTGSAAAGLAAGIFATLVPARFTQISHIQHVWTPTLPLLIAALILIAVRPTALRGALFGGLFLLNGLINLHWLAFGSLAIALSIPLAGWITGAARQAKFWACASLPLVIAGALLIPVLLPYRAASELYGMRGDAAETLSYSAKPDDWLAASLHLRWWGKTNDGSTGPERWLFPGAIGLILAASSLSAIANRARPPELNAGLAIGLLWIALGFAGSLGLNGTFHSVLFEHIPLYGGIRVPARWAFICYTGMSLLIAIGVAALIRRLKPLAGFALAALFAALLLVELNAAPVRYFFAPLRVPPVYSWLAGQAPRGAVLELPLAPAEQYEMVWRSTVHRRRLVNGISGFVPPSFERLRQRLLEGPATEALLAELETMNVAVLIVHADRLGDESAATRTFVREALRSGRLAFLGRFEHDIEGDFVFALTRVDPGSVWRAPSNRADPAGRTPADNLRLFLEATGTIYNEETFGRVELPDGVAYGAMTVGGWAFSRKGIEQVLVHFGNDRLVMRAELLEDPALLARYPWYPATPRPRFLLKLNRPPGIEGPTDVQIEIVERGGTRVRLPHVWFDWVDR